MDHYAVEIPMHRLGNFTLLNENFNHNEYFIIDAKVYGLYKEHLSFLIDKKVFFVESPEESKSLEVFEKVTNFFLGNGIKRSSTLVVIGGGATSDLGGFVASTILRGVDWAVVPTTLLSMIDASIGGKVGINTVQGKNLIGSFHAPIKNITTLDFLKTLDKKDYHSGLGEMVKYLFIDAKLDLSLSHEKLIFKCATLKESIVARDFNEKGQREVLNYGHTFGHAVEKMTSLSHGLCVLIGIKLNISLFSPSLESFFNEAIKGFDLVIPKLSLDREEFLNFLTFDKKNTQEGEIRFITFKKRGEYETLGVEMEKLNELLLKADCYDHFFA